VDGGEGHAGEGHAISRNGLAHDDATNSDGPAHSSQVTIHLISIAQLILLLKDLEHRQTFERSLLSDKEVLMLLEHLYELILQLEHMRREQPPMEEEVAFDQWYIRFVLSCKAFLCFS
jgi:hypothetical protein